MSNKIINLTEAVNNKDFKIAEILDKALSLKMLEMGCVKGTIIEKQNAAPLHGPVLIKVFPGGNLLAIRYEEAKSIMVTSQTI